VTAVSRRSKSIHRAEPDEGSVGSDANSASSLSLDMSMRVSAIEIEPFFSER
jgi:hypothetical protein